MASVFLSYDHEDSAKARQVALALEKRGHDVWWDRHIHGGAQYAKEIEQAIARADTVVVLWSTQSIESEWVRDEAMAGKARGRLIPVRIDGSEPPIGFRQFQAIDLSTARGRKWTQGLEDIQAAIGSLTNGHPTPPAKPAAPALFGSIASANARPILIAALVFIAIAGLLVWRPWKPDSLPLVSVEPADQSGSAKTLASDLLIKLGSLQSTEAAALRLAESGPNSEPDFTFKVGTRPGEARANVALVDRGGALLWSREFVQPSGSEADLRQQVAYSAGQVLRCATEALARNHPRLDPSVLGLYLNGCADLSATNDPQVAIATFRTVTEKAPRFAGGWGKLLIAELEAFKATSANDLSLQQEMRHHAAEAGKIDPEMAEIYLVQSWLQAPRPIIRWMRYADEAVEKKPDNAAILINHATGLGHVGRMREAVEDARRASEIEPLSPGASETLIAFLGDSGNYSAARRELDKAERLWPGATNIVQARFWFEYNYGDPKKALAIIESGKLGFLPSPAQTSFLHARATSNPANIALAIADARKVYEQDGNPGRLIQTLGAFGRKDEAIDVLLSADPRASHGIISSFFRRSSLKEVRRDPRFMTIARRYGLVDYWTAAGRWPDYCFEPGLPYDCKKEAAKSGKPGASP